MDIVAGGYGEPKKWVLVFVKSSEIWWVRWLARGRYKHVCAFGFVEEAGVWVFYDVRFARTQLFAVNRSRLPEAVTQFAADADLMWFETLLGGGRGFRVGLWCVPAIKHLIGIRSGALRPDALWRDCLRHGGQPIPWEKPESQQEAAPSAAPQQARRSDPSSPVSAPRSAPA